MQPGVADDVWMKAQEGDSFLLVAFSVEAVKNESKSLEEGRPIFDEAEFVKIMVPGDRNNVVHRPVNAEDKQRFQRQLEAWRGGKDDPAGSGTPLREWAGLSRSEVAELAHFGVRTVEALASLSDGNARNIGPILRLRKKAQEYVAAAKEAAPTQKLLEAIAARDEKIADMERRLKEMSDDIAEEKRAKKAKKE